MGRRIRFVFAAWLLAVIFLVSGARGQDYWAGLSSDDLMKEARAGFHLGLLDADALPTSGTLVIPTSLDLVNRLLAMPALSGELRRQAYRLKLQIFDRRGLHSEWQETYNALPATLDGIPAADWDRQRLLWSIIHDGAQYEWGKVKSALAHFNSAGLKKDARADHVLLKCRSDIRHGGGSAQGYLDLAEAIAGDATWELDDPYFDPYFGQTYFSQLESWAMIEPLLQLLGSNPEDQNIGLRRWFEFAAPSVLNPLGSIFHDAPADARAALIRDFQVKALAFAPDITIPIPATGGYRELLGHTIRIENLIYTGQAEDILDAVTAAPDDIAGFPPNFITAHKIAWRMFGLAGTLAIGDAVQAVPQLQVAVFLLPPSPFRAFTHSLTGLALLSQGKPEGNEEFARAFLIAIPHPKLADQMIRGLLSNTNGMNARAVLDILAQPVYQPSTLPQTLSVRALFAIRHFEKFPETERNEILSQALADGATALDRLERNADPAQAHWREVLKEPLIQAVGIVDGEQKAQLARTGFEQQKPIRQNAALGQYAPNVGGPSNSIQPIYETITEFELQVAKGKGKDLAALTIQMQGLSAEQSQAALASLPDHYLDPHRVRVGRVVCEEADRRGITVQNFSGDWRAMRVKRCETLLNWPETSGGARSELAAIASDPVGGACCNRARVALDALSTSPTLAGYLWAQDWLIALEKEFPARTHLHDQLTTPLLIAAQRPDVVAYLADHSVPPLVRTHYHYNLAQAYRLLGQPELALHHFEQMIQIAEEEQVGDEVTLFVAETRRMGVWMEQADRAEDDQTKREIWQRVVEAARHRLTTRLGTDEMRQGYGYWGKVAAIKLKDSAAAQEFRDFQGTTPAETRLF